MRKVYKYLFLLILLVVYSTATALAEPGIRVVTLTMVEDPQTTQTISWQTDAAADAGWLEYREADVPETAIATVQKIRVGSQPFVTDLRSNQVYRATLRKLKPATRYIYRIGNDSGWLYESSFQTETPQAPFQFLLFGDSQSTDYREWQRTFAAAFAQGSKARFFVNVGDLVDNGQTQREWDAWFAGIRQYSGSLPLVPVVGNHETYTPQRKFSMPEFFTQQFAVPQNGPEGLKGQVYSFDYGEVHFAVLDSQFGEEREFLPDSLERQKQWLTQDLAATDKRWKIVFVHRPIYHNRSELSAPSALVALVPIFDAYQVDVVFNGHDHVNARTPRLYNGKPSESGTVYSTVGRSGTKTYQTVERKDWNTYFLNMVDQPTYSIVSVNGSTLSVQVFAQNGRLMDEWALLKNN